MNGGLLLDGTKIQGEFSMLIGAVANPYMKPLELNILRLGKKAAAGANFIQTQAVFDVETFQQWFEAAGKEGITEKTVILAGVLPLQSAARGQKLLDTHTDFNIPVDVLNRIKAAGDPEAQQQEGSKIAIEIIKKLKAVPGLRGVHILSGGNEAVVPDLLTAI
jgi:methylenetetrahydrofolate reductase (NADPH)